MTLQLLATFAGMKISTTKTEVLHLSRNPVQCSMQVGSVLLKQVNKLKHRGVAFTSDQRQEKLEVRSGKASALMRALHHLVTRAIEKVKTVGV